MKEDARKIWSKKLAFLEAQDARLSDPNQRFTLAMHIGEARDILAELDPVEHLNPEEHLNPDVEWYTAVSDRMRVTCRCPFASVHRCPRYFEGISLLGEEGALSRLDPKLDHEIGAKWEATDVWPAVWHEHSGISSSGGKPWQYRDFCPEITGEAFGLFASILQRFSTESDKKSAQNRLASNRIGYGKNWRWHWSSISEMHYTQCPIYSLLSVTPKQQEMSEVSEPLFTAKPEAFGFSVDLIQLVSRARRWWSERG